MRSSVSLLALFLVTTALVFSFVESHEPIKNEIQSGTRYKGRDVYKRDDYSDSLSDSQVDDEDDVWDADDDIAV